MKKYSWIIFAAAMVIASCDPLGFETQTNYDDYGNVINHTIVLDNGTVLDVCNTATYNLNAGNTFKDAGDVLVSNDNDNLYVTVYATYGFQNVSENLKVWVGTNLDLLPANNNGVPIQGQFPYKTTVANGVKEYTFTIPFADIDGYGSDVTCNTKFYTYVHGDVFSDMNGGTDTAWGGDTCKTSQDKTFGKRWVCSIVYQGRCCGTPPPPDEGYTQTAFAKGNFVFTTDTKSNPEKLASLNLTKNRWGWAINIKDVGSYEYEIWAGAGLNYTSNGTLVGTLRVTWDGSNATVAYEIDPDFSLCGIHVYAGDFRPTTIAPGQYGYTMSFDPKVNNYSNTFAVADSGTDGIWIIAHAGVFGDY
jgi:YD repeat-containing protein